MSRFVVTLTCTDRPGIVHALTQGLLELEANIEQDVVRVSHAESVEVLIAIGREVEWRVLASAVRSHSQHKVFLNGSKTVVFR